MRLSEYLNLDWQSKDEVFWDWCESNDIDPTEGDITELKEAMLEEFAQAEIDL